MSVKVSSWVWHGEETAKLGGNEMILLLALADVAADDGRCIYLTDDDDLTYAGLAKKARVDRRTVIRLVAKLRERGLLGQTKGTRGQPNEFAIAVPWRRGDNLSPVDSVTSEAVSVTSEALFGDKPDDHSSYRRTDVDVTPVVPIGDATETAFTVLWEKWPSTRRGASKKSRSSFRTALSEVGGIRHADVILAAVDRDVAVWRTWPRADVQYIPLLPTWLNQERWRPENAAQPRGPQGTFAQQKQNNMLDLVGRIQEKEHHARIGSRQTAGLLGLDRGAGSDGP